MGKAEAGTPKAISNQMKSKGLQRLRWFCQMCEKQCRDENGFKCHTMSESHQRQMTLFSENSSTYMSKFSKEFLTNFIDILRRRFGTCKVKANTVYQEYISDKQHLHMNSTQWISLSEFVKYLGKKGICKVEDTEKGWFISFIDRNPEVLARQEALEKKLKSNLDDQQRHEKILQKQIESGLLYSSRKKASTSSLNENDEISNFSEDSDEDKKSFLPLESPSKRNISFALKKNQTGSNSLQKTSNNIFQSASLALSKDSPAQKIHANPEKRKISALEEIKQEIQSKKNPPPQDENLPWIQKNLIVKITHKTLNHGKYHLQKGTITNLFSPLIADIKMSPSNDLIRIHQKHLQTVLPPLQGPILCVKGPHQGSQARLVSLQISDFAATIKLASGQTLSNIPYEHICKLDLDS